MKTNKFLTIAAALMLTSCTNNDPVVDETKDTPITIASAGVAELETRVITDDNKLEGIMDGEHATMSVFIKSNSTETKYNATNMYWYHDGDHWDCAETVLFEGTSSSQKIYACSPYDANAASGSIAVTAASQIDWLVATATDLKSNSVTLEMTHALAKLVLDPTFGTELTNQEITAVKVDGMYASGTLNISDNSWSNCGTANATLPMANNELLVIPMSNCTSFSIVITMEDARVFKTTINCPVIETDANGENIYGLAPGTQYNIKLQVGQDKVALGDITASTWGTSTGGELETE